MLRRLCAAPSVSRAVNGVAPSYSRSLSAALSSLSLSQHHGSTTVKSASTASKSMGSIHRQYASTIVARSMSSTAGSASQASAKLLKDVNQIEVTPHATKKPIAFDPIWLRDNCPCPECIHPSTRQKLHASSQVPLDISVSNVQPTDEGLELTWSKGLDHVGDWEDPAKAQPGHKSVYPWTMLLDSYGGSGADHRFKTRMNHDSKLWDGEMMKDKVLWVEYDQYMQDPNVLLKGLKHLQEYGLFFVKNVPTEDQQVATVAERIGHLRHTFYGRTWDVKSVPNAKNIAYTNLNLGLHMDLLYMEAPPGLQLLHSLENSVPGGTSIFMDSFKAVELLKKEHPDLYKILTTTPTAFHYLHADHHLHYNRPTICLDDFNSTLTVNYAPPFQAPLELPQSQMKDFYKALRQFAEYIERPDLQYRHTMRPGECMVFANRRVLHARTAFDPSKGNRHLKGCYVDLDMFKDKYRITHRAKDQGEF